MAKRIKLKRNEVKQSAAIKSAVEILIGEGIIVKSSGGYLEIIRQPFIKRRKKNSKKKTGKRKPASWESVLADDKRQGAHKKYENTPSERREFSKWKRVGDINNWTPNDFLGYYLHRFKEYYGEEDVGMSLPNRKAFDGKRKHLRKFMAKAFATPKGINNSALKDYIDWTFDVWLDTDDADFLKGQISFYLIFNLKSATIVKKWKGKLWKRNQSRKKGDDDYSKKEAWEDYIDR